tara:strand:- start:381 stop:689 length:309 start_codon:yes stop_codon:yes gene_type:complete
MSKLIFAIKGRNKSFNLLESIHKEFGVVFHPKSTVASVENFIKEKANDKATSEASGKVQQDHNERTGLVEKAEEATDKQESTSLGDTSSEVPPNSSLTKRDK